MEETRNDYAKYPPLADVPMKDRTMEHYLAECFKINDFILGLPKDYKLTRLQNMTLEQRIEYVCLLKEVSNPKFFGNNEGYIRIRRILELLTV